MNGFNQRPVLFYIHTENTLVLCGIVRALNLRPSLYTKLLDHFHSSGIELDRLSALWARAVLGLFPSPVRINGRLVLVGDGRGVFCIAAQPTCRRALDDCPL
jgi:hypothetical protein